MVRHSRFAQHNSLNGTPGKGNKAVQIDDWFHTHDRLGFSLGIQDSLANEVYDGNALLAEGQLIEGYRQLHGKFPLGNGISGNTDGHKYAGTDTAIWFDIATGKVDGSYQIFKSPNITPNLDQLLTFYQQIWDNPHDLFAPRTPF